MALWPRTAKAGEKLPKNADGAMSLMDHLHELRRRLFIAVVGLLVGVVIGFIWFANGIPSIGLPTLGEILKAPYCAVPSPPRAILSTAAGRDPCTFLQNTVFSGLQIRLKSALMVGAVISSPVWLLQLWGFVTPALYSKEKRYTRIFVGSAAVLMVTGAVLAYWVIHEALKVLLGFAGSVADTALDPNAYYSFLIGMLLIFGISFLLPLLLIMLNLIGVVKGKKLAEIRRFAYFGLVVFTGLVVPGNDPLTMLALAVALCFLYEIAVQFSKIHDKRKDKRLAAESFTDLDDDTASPTPVAAGALNASDSPSASPTDSIPAPEPITRSELEPSASGPRSSLRSWFDDDAT
ncbi:twin-arginine translocase subunit TatC [Nakamurella sp. A5-74]|uniref:Sec-independent protein translocase protein TatC n=1 Tax=Nakamurella sp. A5-74 TaxID=3158264 RepID=A0AAU8DWK9_9ACTN